MPNNAGVATPFATLSPLKSAYHSLKERLVLAGAQVFRTPEPIMRKRAFLHHAYWIRVPARSLRAHPQAPLSLKGALLFLSSYTGNQADYLRGFTANLPKEMDLIWDCSTDWPGAEDNAKCAEFIEKFFQERSVFFNAYGEAGIRAVRKALYARHRLDEFATELAGADEQHFARAFTVLAKALLEEVDREPPELA